MVAMGEMRLEVVIDGGVQRRGVTVGLAKPASAMGEGIMVSRGLLSLSRSVVCRLSVFQIVAE